MPAPAGAFSVFPHCRSSVCSRRSLFCISPCRSSARSCRSLFCISPLPQQCLLPQERYLYFPTAAAVSAPAGTLSVFFPLPQQCSLQQEPFLLPAPPPPLSQQPHATQESPPAVFFTTAVVPALAGTFSIFPHCRSSACSSRNLLYISPLPQQWLLPQEHLLFFPTTAVVSAPAGALSIFPLPQQWLLPQERYLYFLTAAVVTAPLGSAICISLRTFSIFPHCPSSVRSRRSSLHFFPTAAAVPAPAGAFSIFPHCPSSVCSRRSATCISSLPQ